MQIKNARIKTLFKLLITISLFECIYLFAFPIAINSILNSDFINNIFENNTNAEVTYKNAKVKTHITPRVYISADEFILKEKGKETPVIDVKSAQAKLSLFSLICKKINVQEFYADTIISNIDVDKEGNLNFKKLFNKKEGESSFSFKLKNSDFTVKNLSINTNNEQLATAISFNASPFNLNTEKNNLKLISKGSIIANEKTSEFDIDLTTKFPFSIKNLNSNFINGKCYLYNVDLAPLFPYVQNYLNKEVTQLEGLVDFIQFSAEKDEDNKNKIILNTQFKDVIFNKSDWKNKIVAKGENKFDTRVELYENILDVKSLKYKADKVNIKGDGKVIFDKKPEIDLNIEVTNSRTENIAPLLPPAIPKQYRTIEKVKSYGVFGDIEGKVKVQGKIPQPNITGYVKGRNVHVLDKSLHPLHKGTVDITFDKRILNMDILVEMFDNQRATVKGYTYMFRDGVNNVTIKTTDNIDFPLAQKIVVPVSKVFNFQLGPIPEMDITSGKGIIDVNIQGSVDFVNINGYSSFDKAQLTYNGLYGEVLDGKGRLDFNGDVVSFKSERAFVKNNPLSVDGRVRINKDLNFNISSNKAEAKDLLEIINKSTLLKDVKEGLAIITDASGSTKIDINMRSSIVPVPMGHPPLPPEEAFADMKVNGSLYMFGDKCYIEGFKTPIENIKGVIDFTETKTTIHDITGVVGTSPITLSGTVLNDLETRIPDVDLLVTSKSVNLKDTVRFLCESYLYPAGSPDLSPLYNIASKHDLYFKYKAKSIDFLTDKAYAVMNFVPDTTDSVLKAEKGQVVMDKATVTVNNVVADFFDSKFGINGNVERVDTLTPIYNLMVNTNKFNLENLNNSQKIEVLPKEMQDLFAQFGNYKGYADVNFGLNKNLLVGNIKFNKPQFIHTKSNIPFNFDNFNIYFNNGIIHINDMVAQIADMPFFGDISISEITKSPRINGYFTSKITDDFLQKYVPKNISDKIKLVGDINLSSKLSGTSDNLTIMPKITFFPDADITIDGTSLGEISDKREFDADINITKDKINVRKLDYIKYIASQNNKINPIVFATINGLLAVKQDNIIEPIEVNVKTHKNISARILNILLKKPILKQGSFSCDMKYNNQQLKGTLDARNLDIPLFDTVVKNVKINADKDIDLSLFGFLNDSKIKIESIIENNLISKPEVHLLKISADQLDNDKLLRSLSKARQAMNTNNEIKNVDFTGFHLCNGIIEVKKLIVKSLIADDVNSHFTIDEKGIFKADDINLKVGQGNIKGHIQYDLMNNKFNGDFELANVDSNYVAETLFYSKNQVYGNANGKVYLESQGTTDEEIIKNLQGFVYFDISDGKMPKLGSLEYLLRASNIIKSGITGFTLNSILEILNLVKTGYFSNINGSCKIENGVAKDIEIFSKGENLSLYIHGTYDISKTHADMEILGRLSRKISTVFGTVGNASLNTFFKLIPGISMLDFSRKDFIEDVEKIPTFTNGDYEAKVFQAIINGDINDSNYVQIFKWVQ